jgi:hypothetical protein
MRTEAHKFVDIYDRLNDQPHLQDIIKQHCYEAILKEEAKEAKFHVLDTLNYAFKNARIHQEEIYGRTLEKTMLTFMKHSMFYQVVRNGKHGPQIYGWHGIIEYFYGDDWNDYYNQHYYSYITDIESDSDSEFYDCVENY